MKPTCLNCKFLKIIDTKSGHCRVENKKNSDRKHHKPTVALDDSCEMWEDSGQQYYIRIGWLKSQENE